MKRYDPTNYFLHEFIGWKKHCLEGKISFKGWIKNRKKKRIKKWLII